MRYRTAKKLHNGDQVTIKGTKQTEVVLNTLPTMAMGQPAVWIFTKENPRIPYLHIEVC